MNKYMFKIRFFKLFGSVSILILLGYFFTSLILKTEYNWQWYRVSQYFFSFENGIFAEGLLLKGLIVTLKISLISLFFTIFIGLSTALMRLSSSPVLNFFVILYVELIRNTPLLIQIFIIYFVISPVIELSSFASAVVALSLFEGAYACEIIRTGISNISKGQWEASWSLGLTSFQNYRYIVLPQVLKRTLPMLAGLGVALIKDSALVSTISIYDLTMRGQSIVADTFLTFEIWFSVALCYFVLTASFSAIISFWEKRLS